jgi:hypothetical protein
VTLGTGNARKTALAPEVEKELLSDVSEFKNPLFGLCEIY